MGTVKPEDDTKQDLNDSGCVQDASMGEGYRGQAGLLDLSDDVLLYLLGFCSPMDLKALGFTCTRLARLICDRTLWHRVNSRDTPIGSERLRWFLKHCFSAATTELAITGYANRQSRCMGIQDLNWPHDNESVPRQRAPVNNSDGLDVGHFLLRMWYPHLPRYAVSPRWPDRVEAANHMKVQNAIKKYVRNAPPEPDLDEEIPMDTAEDDTDEYSDPESLDLSQEPTARPSRPGPSRRSGPKPGPSAVREMEQLRDTEKPDNCSGPYFTFNERLMKDLSKKCSQLTSLFLEYCNIDYKATNIRSFPPKLKKLSLRGTRCYNLPLNMSYLCKIQDQLPLLEYLDVSECEWFEPASLMPLSKLPVLKELYMKDCVRLTECVAYASLATRYGFRQLRVLDVRGSPISDSEISAVGWLPLLEELYCAPGDDFRSTSEHTHAWSERLEHYHELQPWELEEPEYFRVKTPELDSGDEDEVRPVPNVFDEPITTGTNTPWWSHERRIIVIQPSADTEPDPGPVRLQNLGLQVEPGPSGAGPSRAGPSAAKRPNTDNVLDLVKRPRLARDEEPEELELERPVISAEDCPRLNRVLNRPILIGRQQPINRPVQPDGPSNDAPRNINLPRDDVPQNDEPPQGFDDLKADAPPQPSVSAPQPVSESPQPESFEDDEQSQPEESEQPSESVPPMNVGQAAPRANVPLVNVQTQTGEPPVNVLVPQNIVPAQVDEPQPGGSNEPVQQVVTRGVNVTVAVKLTPDFSPTRNVNVTVKVTPPERNAPLAGNGPLPGHVHFVNREPPFVPVRQFPYPHNPPSIHQSQIRNPFCIHGNPIVPEPQPEPQPIFVTHEIRGAPQVYAPYANGPQAIIIPGNVAPINAGPQAHLLMRPNRALRNVNVVPPGNPLPYVPPPYADPAYNNNAIFDLAEEEEDYIQDIIEGMEENARNERPRLVRFRRNNMRDHMHVDLDIHHHHQVHQSHAHLVTDSAILRFGRADNDDINYVHIGRAGDGANEQGNRPDRSNLRILSATGYRNITNRSLQHLATAAPHLRMVDFSETSVTQNGVDIFKAIRPNCEVVFSEYDRRP